MPTQGNLAWHGISSLSSLYIEWQYHSLCWPVGDAAVLLPLELELEEPGHLQADGGDQHHPQVAEVRRTKHQGVTDGLVPWYIGRKIAPNAEGWSKLRT